MRKPAMGLLGALIAYVAIGALLHYVVFPEPSPPPELYPAIGDAWGSEAGGTEQRVLDQQGDRLYMEVRVTPGAQGPPEHVHTSFEEDFHIQSGTLTLWVDGERKQLGPGESLSVPPGIGHTVTNEGLEVAVSRHWRSRDHVFFLSQMYGFLNEAEENSRPPRLILQVSLFANDGGLAGAPIWLQRSLFFVLARTARLLGYRSYYERFAPQRPSLRK